MSVSVAPQPRHATIANRCTPATSTPGRPARTTTNTAPLGNRENSRPVQVDDGFWTRHLWRLQRAVWKVTRLKAIRECHRLPVPEAAEVSVNRTGKGGRGRFGGLRNSHSVWASPIAAVGIARGRQAEVREAAERWLGEDPRHAVAMLTLTVRHRHGESLEQLLDGLAKAWARVVSNRVYKGADGIRARYGLTHNCWFLEVTHGDNGWHPHRHMVLLLDRALSDDELAALKGELHALWADKVTSIGLRAPSEAHGVDLQQVATDADGAAAVSTYAAKGMFAGLSAEVTGGSVKRARNGNRTPFQILEDIAARLEAGEEPDPRDVALWHEYERATRGRKQRRWSNGALKALGMEARADEELEELEELASPEEQAEEPTALVSIPRESWRALSWRVDARLEVLEAANSGNTPEEAVRAVTGVLDRLGVTYRRVMVQHEFTEMITPTALNSPVVAAEARSLLTA